MTELSGETFGMIWICEKSAFGGGLVGVPNGARRGVVVEMVGCSEERRPALSVLVGSSLVVM